MIKECIKLKTKSKWEKSQNTQKETSINSSKGLVNLKNNNSVLYFKKVVIPNDQEKNKHDQYLKTSLKKNFF